MAWLAVDKDNTEYIFEHKPERNKNILYKSDFGWLSDECFIVIPNGAIALMLGHKLTWGDDPVEI